MNRIHIKKAATADIPIIRSIALATWPVTYSPILSAGQIEYMLHTLYSVPVLQEQMDTESQQYLLAFLDETPVAFAAFSNHKEPLTYKLQKLYVLPHLQKSGAGNALLQTVENNCFTAGARRLILNVHRSNKARYFYEKNGFRIYQVVDIPFGPHFVLNDFLMEKELTGPFT